MIHLFEIRNAGEGGQGLFSLAHFEANQILFTFKGHLLDKREVDIMPLTKISLLLQISDDRYLDLGNRQERFINHSCNANCAIKLFGNAAFLLTLRAIKPSEELTFDYSLTSSDTLDTWQMKCPCKSWNCRGLISGFQYLNDKEKEKYVNLKLVPTYVMENK